MALIPRELGSSAAPFNTKNMFKLYANKSAVRASRVSITGLSKSSSHSSLNRASVQPETMNANGPGSVGGASPTKQPLLAALKDHELSVDVKL